jgi:hypothetical protein
MKPRPTKPKIIMAQVEGSGTAATTGASIEKLPEAIVEPFKPSCTCHPFVNISKVAAGAEKFCSEVRVKITPAPPEPAAPVLLKLPDARLEGVIVNVWPFSVNFKYRRYLHALELKDRPKQTLPQSAEI